MRNADDTADKRASSKALTEGGCYQYDVIRDNGHISRYRIVVAAQVGSVIFCHAVFTTGKMQTEASVHALDTRFLKNLTAVKFGEAFKNSDTEDYLSPRG